MTGGQEEKKPTKMVRSSIACSRCRRSKVKCKSSRAYVQIIIAETSQASIPVSTPRAKLAYKVVENVHTRQQGYPQLQNGSNQPLVSNKKEIARVRRGLGRSKTLDGETVNGQKMRWNPKF
jgi:hypothetical protein